MRVICGIRACLIVAAHHENGRADFASFEYAGEIVFKKIILVLDGYSMAPRADSGCPTKKLKFRAMH